MSKLSGDVDPQKIIDLAPGELNNLPDYTPGNEGETSTLGDHPAYVLGGTYTRDGATRFIAQKTVVIPAADGLYVLQLNVDGPEAAGDVLGQPPRRSTATPRSADSPRPGVRRLAANAVEAAGGVLEPRHQLAMTSATGRIRSSVPRSDRRALPRLGSDASLIR